MIGGDGSLAGVAAASTAFVGTHFLLSHPWRRGLVRAMGEPAFLGVYSVVAATTLLWIAWAYRATPAGAPAWNVGEGLWAVVTIVMLGASVLLAGSLVGNPALPDPTGRTRPPVEPQGVFAVTRHPMMWSFALWAVCHVLIYPVAKNMVVALAILVLALAGAAAQDRKKARLDPVGWPGWVTRTSYWPFASILTGRARLRSPGLPALGGGVAVWLAATWAHIPLAGWPAGVWRWIIA